MNPTEASQKIDKLLNQAWSSRRKDNYRDTKVLVEEAAKLCKTHDLKEEYARTLKLLAQIEHDTDSLREALRYYDEAVNIYRQLDNKNKLAHTIRHIADIRRELDEFENARENYHEALRLYDSNGTTGPLDLANAIRGLALAVQELQPEEAVAHWAKARDLYEEVGVSAGVDECNDHITTLSAVKK